MIGGGPGPVLGGGGADQDVVAALLAERVRDPGAGPAPGSVAEGPAVGRLPPVPPLAGAVKVTRWPTRTAALVALASTFSVSRSTTRTVSDGADSTRSPLRSSGETLGRRNTARPPSS